MNLNHLSRGLHKSVYNIPFQSVELGFCLLHSITIEEFSVISFAQKKKKKTKKEEKKNTAITEHKNEKKFGEKYDLKSKQNKKWDWLFCVDVLLFVARNLYFHRINRNLIDGGNDVDYKR